MISPARHVPFIFTALLLGGCILPPPPPSSPFPPPPPDLPIAVPGSPPPQVPEEATEPKDVRHLLTLTIGAGYWPEIGDLDPSSSGFSPSDFGEFDEWGFAFDMGYQGRVAQFDRGSLWLGADFGIGSFQNERSFDVLFLPSGDTIDGSYSAGLFYFTPTIAYRHPLGSGVDGFARAGFGYYSLSLTESFSGYSNDIDSDDGFGGFLAFGLDIQLSDGPIFLRIEDQIHFVTLDPFPDVLPAENEVDGPIHFFMIGVAVGL